MVIAGPPSIAASHRKRRISAGGDDADFSLAGMCAAVGVIELFAQFCANQLVRRAIAGTAEKYFSGTRGPWIIFAWVGDGQRASPACAAAHAGDPQKECIKHGIFLRSPKS
ncbi:MAG TPA: hypothetical protein VL118_01250, partial [Luteimonas sp.]|nr:hypothetical protein [Luteimonas sp.]